MSFSKSRARLSKSRARWGKQQKEIDALKAELREQRFLIQKVSDKMELSELVTKVATHDP
jgi:uncharacterized coiled-coil protein SlyX